MFINLLVVLDSSSVLNFILFIIFFYAFFLLSSLLTNYFIKFSVYEKGIFLPSLDSSLKYLLYFSEGNKTIVKFSNFLSNFFYSTNLFPKGYKLAEFSYLNRFFLLFFFNFVCSKKVHLS